MLVEEYVQNTLHAYVVHIFLLNVIKIMMMITRVIQKRFSLCDNNTAD